MTTDAMPSATEARTASALALQLASQDPFTRGVSLTAQMTIEGHPTQATVYQDGTTKVHDIDNSIVAQIIDAVATIVANALAVFPATAAVGIPLAIADDTANAGLALSNGNVLGAVLSLSAAIAQGYGLAALNTQDAGLAQGYVATQQLIGAASLVVGGVYGAAESIEVGDPAGILGSALEIAGGSAAGLGLIQGISNAAAGSDLGLSAEVFENLQMGLTAAGALTSFGAQVAEGHIIEGLTNSLLPWLSSLATTSIAQGAQTLPGDQPASAEFLSTSKTMNVEVAADPRQILTNQAVHTAAVDQAASEYATLGLGVSTEVLFKDVSTSTIARAEIVLTFGAAPPNESQMAALSDLSGIPATALEASYATSGPGRPFLVIEIKPETPFSPLINRSIILLCKRDNSCFRLE